MSTDLVRRSDEWRPPEDSGGPDVLTGLVRVAAGAWLRGAAWGVGVSVRLVQSASDRRQTTELARDVVEDLQNLFRDLLGISDVSLEERIKRILPAAAAPVEARDRNGALDPATLRAEGAELLRQSADVSYEDTAHPAYAQMLLQLAPDEARILRLLAAEGPQPAVDVRSTQFVRGGEIVAEGLSMIGPEAGVRYVEQVDIYLANLKRLGLVRFSSKPLNDEMPYQVLEAQPEVLEVLKDTSRAKTVHRTLRLTSFGKGFCKTCLPLDEQGWSESVT